MGVYVYLSALCAAFSGFSYGYDLGSLSAVKDMVGYRITLNFSYNPLSVGENGSQFCNHEDDIETSSILGLIVALFSVGATVGSIFGGPLADYIGRKPVLMFGGALVGVGGLVHAAAVHLSMVLLSRLMAGLGTGVMFTVAPVYIGEIVPEKLRGRFLSAITLLALVGYIIASVQSIFLQDVLYGWRIVMSIQGLGGIVVALGMIFALRSPRWLSQHGKITKAEEVLHYIYKSTSEVESHLQKIQVQITHTKSLTSTVKFICQWGILQRLLLGFSIIFLGRMSGGGFIGYFSVTIFCKIGLPGFGASLSIGIVGTITLMLSILIIDRCGRKSIFLASIAVMMFGILLSALMIKVLNLNNLSDEEEDNSSIYASYFTLIVICIYIGAFNLGATNISWILMGELFPLPAKGLVTAICNSAFWIGIVVSNQIGPILISTSLQLPGTLLIFLACAIMLFVIVLLFMPETKGISLEDVEKLYTMSWKERANILYYLKCCCIVELRRPIVDRKRLDSITATNLIDSVCKQDSTSNITSNDKMDVKLETTL